MTVIKIPVAAWRTAAVHIDCPTDGCGGGVESRDNGSFTLTREDLTCLMPRDVVTCTECRADFRLPVGAFAAFERRS